MNILAWTSSALLLFGTVCLGRKCWAGWFLNIFGCTGWACWAALDGNDALFFVNACFFVANVWALCKWTDEEDGNDRCR